MIPRTHRQLVSVEVMWPAQTLPLPLQQAVEALTQGETPDQIIARMNLQGFQAWREATSPQGEHDIFRYDWMRHTRHGSSAATLLCRCTNARTCVTRPRASPRTARLDSITSRRADRFLPRRVDAGDNAGVAGRGVFLAEHLRQSQ